MHLFGWFRFPLALGPTRSRRRHKLRRRSRGDLRAPGWQTPAIESLETRRLLAATLSVSNPIPLPEGDSGTSNMIFVVTRSGDTAHDVKVDYATVNGTAQAGIDFAATSGTLDFQPGVTSLTVNVPVLDNTIFQSNRTFTLQLGNPSEQLAPLTFAAGTSFAAGSVPRSVQAVDVNHDGLKDLVVANSGSNSVSVLLNTTAPGVKVPSFAAQQTFAAGSDPTSLAALDVNGDGFKDLVVTNGDTNSVSVLLNTTAPGSKTVSFAALQSFATGSTPNSVTAADLNGDGHQDLIITDIGTSAVSVLLNTTAPGASAASFAAQQTFATGSSPDSVTVADINGDGNQDLIVANVVSGTVSVLLNKTAPGATVASFAARSSFDTGTHSVGVTTADLNGDGRQDVIVEDFILNSVSLLVNTTAPGSTVASFAGKQTFAAGISPFAATAIDLNGDGKLDLVISDDDANGASVLVNSTTPGSTTLSFAPATTLTAGGASQYSTAADLNDDGAADLIVSNYISGSVTVLLNTTALPQSTTVNYAPAVDFATGLNPNSASVADLNGDGRKDLIVANESSSSVSVLLNTTAPGTAVPTFAAQQTFAVGAGSLSVAAADVNGDGRLDLLVANAQSDSVSVLLNTTAPGAPLTSFAAQQTFAAGTLPISLTTADVNDDGRQDLLVANLRSNSVSVLLNTTVPGAATPSFTAQQTFGTGSSPNSVTAADLNGDGRIDLIVANYNSSSVSILLNTTAPGAATSSFAPQQSIATDNGPLSVAAADVNGDGRPDLVVANDNFSGSVSVLLNTTAPGSTVFNFAPRQTFAVGTEISYATVVDLNGDGKLDLLISNYASAAAATVLLNTSTPGSTTLSFSSPQSLSAGASSDFVTAADLNGDGAVDLISTNRPAGTVSVLLATQPPVAISGSPATGTIQDDDAPVAVTPVDGTTPQSAQIGTAFGTNLAVLVTNAAGSPVSNVSVTFTAPGSGASGTFGGSATVLTNSNGIATAPTLTASGLGGIYTVTATAAGGKNPSAAFSLANTPFAPVITDYTIGGRTAHVIQNGKNLVIFINEQGNVVLAKMASPTLATVGAWNNDDATFTPGKISWSDGSVWTLTTTAAPQITVTNYVNVGNSQPAYLVQNGGNTLGFINENGGIALGQWNTPTRANVAAWNNDVATFSPGQIHWSDGSIWNETTPAPLAISVLDYINQANGQVAHVIQNGTSALAFVNEHETIVLGNVNSPTLAKVAAWNNDVATFTPGTISWSDGSIWTLTTTASARLTVVNYLNPANGKVAHLITNLTNTVVFVNEHGNIVLGNLSDSTHALVSAWNNDLATIGPNAIHWSDGSVWNLI